MNALALALRDPMIEKDLSDEARRDLDYWRGLIGPVLQEKRGIRAHLLRIAMMSGQPFKTVHNRYYAAKKHGLLGLVDKRLAGPRFWKLRSHRVAAHVSQSRGLQELWKSLCEANQRKCRPQFKVLVQLWKQRSPRIGAIPEYADFPGWPKLPPGWTYGNLMRYAPSGFELTAARQGKAAAAAHRRTVFTTRVGCYVGSHLMIDDKWNDFFVNSFADGQAGRPLEVYTLDYFSARKCRWATRVRTKDEAGNYKGIAEIMTRYVLAAHLYLDGYSPRGTVIVAEHGTAAVRERVAAALHELSGGLITLSESGMTGDTSHIGQYPGLVRGNPRHKAALESNNNREHNAFGALPGQTGMSVERRPEELTGRLAYNAQLLAAYAQLPAERRAMLDFPVLELNQYLSVAAHVYKLLEDDRQHELEGWVEAGNVVQSYRFGSQDILETELTPEQRAAIVPMLEARLIQARPLRMSRREVWDRGAGELVRLPGWGVVSILGADLARPVTVVDNMISLRDSEWWPGTYSFETDCRDAEGRHLRLPEGETYQAFINPFAAGTLFVSDAKGRYVGECRRIHAPSRGDLDGVRRAMGEAAKDEAAMLTPLRARHLDEAREKRDRHVRNAEAMNDRAALPPKPSAAQNEKNQDLAAARA
ncbi:MAG: hypothetical protein HY302_09255, partial [Opitutae bacterium]|nr:hypothetical protein [Opitutae bacterium]